MSDISITQGDTLSWQITIPAGDGPASLRGVTARAGLRGKAGYLKLTAIVTHVEERRLYVSASSAATRAMPSGLYQVELQLITRGGVVQSNLSTSCQIERSDTA